MKICIIGANGFVGSSLSTYLSQFHTITKVTRNTLDVLDPQLVRRFLQDNYFDVIINAAATMADNNGIADTRNNFGLFMNFYSNKDLFNKFINLGSGAEFDRNTDINQAHPNNIFSVLPTDSYGFGQNMKSRVCVNTDNFYNIRIFNCFGLNEISSRIFPRYLNIHDNFKITDDRYFDYFGIRDLCLVVNHCIKNQWTIKDVNAVYEEKHKISKVLTKFCELNNLQKKFEIISTSDKNYTGCNQNLKNLNIQLNGLEYELQHYKEKLI
jgi:GDP-L-fucose synthase